MRMFKCFSSVDSAVLQSRTADPEELLYNLGFGGCDQLARWGNTNIETIFK